MTKRYHKPGARAAKLAEEQAVALAKGKPSDPAIPARIEIGEKKTQRVDFNLCALEHPLSFKPILSLQDYFYLLDELLPNNGIIRTTLPPYDDEERSYHFALAQTPAVVPVSATLVLHLLEAGGGDLHVMHFYRSIAEEGWEWFATGIENDAQTWDFNQDEHSRLLKAAETHALQRQLEQDTIKENAK